jgi:hypothetical protein
MLRHERKSQMYRIKKSFILLVLVILSIHVNADSGLTLHIDTVNKELYFTGGVSGQAGKLFNGNSATWASKDWMWNHPSGDGPIGVSLPETTGRQLDFLVSGKNSFMFMLRATKSSDTSFHVKATAQKIKYDKYWLNTIETSGLSVFDYDGTTLPISIGSGAMPIRIVVNEGLSILSPFESRQQVTDTIGFERSNIPFADNSEETETQLDEIVAKLERTHRALIEASAIKDKLTLVKDFAELLSALAKVNKLSQLAVRNDYFRPMLETANIKLQNVSLGIAAGYITELFIERPLKDMLSKYMSDNLASSTASTLATMVEGTVSGGAALPSYIWEQTVLITHGVIDVKLVDLNMLSIVISGTQPVIDAFAEGKIGEAIALQQFDLTQQLAVDYVGFISLPSSREVANKMWIISQLAILKVAEGPNSMPARSIDISPTRSAISVMDAGATLPFAPNKRTFQLFADEIASRFRLAAWKVQKMPKVIEASSIDSLRIAIPNFFQGGIFNWSTVIFEADTFVAVGGVRIGANDKGQIIFSPVVAYSKDGLAWSLGNIENDTSQGALLLDVTYGAGTFVAVGFEGTIITSADGINWQVQYSDFQLQDRLMSVTFGKDAFVATGAGFSDKNKGRLAYKSLDKGKTWQSIFSTYQEIWLNSVKFINGEFIVVGDFEYTLTSPDLTHWSRNSLKNIGRQHKDITFGNQTYALLSLIPNPTDEQRKSGFLGNFAISKDGKVWVNSKSDGITWPETIQYVRNQFVALGNGGDLFSSENGETWEKVEMPRHVIFQGIAYGAGRYVVVGRSFGTSQQFAKRGGFFLTSN